MSIDTIQEYLPIILKGFWITVRLFLWSLIFSTVAGFILALMRISSVAILRWISGLIGWLFRGVPLLLILFYAFFALPEISRSLMFDPFWAAVVGLSIWTAAYQSEAIRSGIIAVEKGQFEASEALGMTKRHYMRRIVIPQSIRITVPPFIGNAINTMKQTSLAAVITVPEMTLLARQIISEDFKVAEPLLALAFIYLVLTTMLLMVQLGLERIFRLKV
jgi:His/Glu/Gln/Arg/opine family amino acid ABC transporter permease subunit